MNLEIEIEIDIHLEIHIDIGIVNEKDIEIDTGIDIDIDSRIICVTTSVGCSACGMQWFWNPISRAIVITSWYSYYGQFWLRCTCAARVRCFQR